MENQQISTFLTETMFCPNCGKSILRKSTFCPECGTKNVLASTSPAPEKEAAPASIEKEPVKASDTAASVPSIEAETTPAQPVSVAATPAPVQSATPVAPERIPCKKCGALLTPRMTFCSVCGKKVTAKKVAVKKAVPSKKIIIIAIIAVAVVISLLLGALAVVLFTGNRNEGSSSSGSSLGIKTSVEDKLRSAYNTHCSSTYATLGTDGSYLEIDTNPNDIDDYINSEAYRAIEKVNNYLGLPSYLFNDMGKTTALMGKQSESFDDLDLTVSWSYHPDNGLEITYKVNK